MFVDYLSEKLNSIGLIDLSSVILPINEEFLRAFGLNALAEFNSVGKMWSFFPFPFVD